jgi:hypothetical protein
LVSIKIILVVHIMNFAGVKQYCRMICSWRTEDVKAERGKTTKRLTKYRDT